MSLFETLRRRLVPLFRRPDEREMDEEMRFHLEMETRENIARGMSPRAARRRARAAFGRLEDVKSDVRRVRPFARWAGELAHDGKVAVRSLPRRPGFVLTVVLTLAIGIAGNVAVLGVIDATLLRSLPYPDADELVLGRVTYQGEVGRTVSGPDFFDYREQARALAGLDAITPFAVRVTVSGPGGAEQISAPLASVGLFETLGVRPLIGRGFAADEGLPGGPDVAVLSHEYWQRRFGGDPEVLGRSITIDGAPHAIVGVMPPGFRFLVDADVWRPIQRGVGWAEARQFHNFLLVGRLAGGITLRGAQEELDVISGQLEAAYPDSNADKGLRITPLGDALAEEYRGTLALLVVAVGFLLLVACANVAGLLMVRGAARRSELTLRSMLGASGPRLARQLLTENALMGIAAAAIGTALALVLQRGILAFLSTDARGPVEAAGLSPAMLGGALGLAAVTIVLFGLFPAIRAARSGSAADLKGGARAFGESGGRLQGAMVVAQVGLTVVLLVGTGLLLRSVGNLRSVDPGFEADGLLTAEISLPAQAYDVGRRLQFYESVRQQVGAMPDVESVGLVNRLPIRDGGGNVRVAPVEQWGQSEGVFERIAYQRMVLPGYFETMGIPLLEGRDVELADTRDAPAVMLVSAALAEALLPGERIVGRVLGVDVGEEEPWTAEVVGVVGDVAPSSLVEGEDIVMYFSYAQRSPSAMRVAVRTRGEAAGLAGRMRNVVASLDPEVPLTGVARMSDVLDASIADRKSVMSILGIFALVAASLAAVGLYGLLAYRVSRRVREIGLRMALGASVGRVARGIVRQGISLVTLGLLVGLPLSLLASRQLRGMLFEVGALDVVTFAGVALFFLAIGTLACAIPARRAAVVDPADAFRAD